MKVVRATRKALRWASSARTKARYGMRRGESFAEAEASRKPDVVFIDTVSHRAKRLAQQIGLSARELEVLEEFARGRSAASIAEKLFISTNTVKTHLRRIYEKAGIHSRRELLDMMEEA